MDPDSSRGAPLFIECDTCDELASWDDSVPEAQDLDGEGEQKPFTLFCSVKEAAGLASFLNPAARLAESTPNQPQAVICNIHPPVSPCLFSSAR